MYYRYLSEGVMGGREFEESILNLSGAFAPSTPARGASWSPSQWADVGLIYHTAAGRQLLRWIRRRLICAHTCQGFLLELCVIMDAGSAGGPAVLNRGGNPRLGPVLSKKPYACLLTRDNSSLGAVGSKYAHRSAGNYRWRAVTLVC